MTMSGSFFNKINTVPSEDLDKYYLSFHATKGFDLERKRYSVGFLSKVVTAIFRIWRLCTGHSYNFEYNVKKFAECMKKDGITRHDLKACSKASKRLVTIINSVLPKKNKSPDELTQLVSNGRFELLEKLAEAQPGCSIEFFSKVGLFSEAKAHILAGDDLTVLSQKCKNDMLGYFLKKKDYELVERMLAAGADPASQSENLLGCIHILLSNPNSALNNYFIMRYGYDDLGFVKESKHSLNLYSEVARPLPAHWQLYLDYPQLFGHTAVKVIKYIDLHWQEIGRRRYKEYLNMVYDLGVAASKVTKNADLSNLLYDCRHRLLSSFAIAEEMTPLEFALEMDFTREAVELVDQGADLNGLSQDDKNLLFSLSVAGSHFTAAEKLIDAGANANRNKNELLLLAQHYKETRNVAAIQTLFNRGGHIADMLFRVNPAHYKNKATVTIPDTMARGCKLDDLLALFDQLNFSNPRGKFYVDPSTFANFNAGYSLQQKIAYLKESVQKFISNIKDCVPFLGTPKEGATLDLFYNIMERAVTHTIRKMKDMPESDEKQHTIRRVISEYIRAALFCGGKQYATACQQFIAVTKGRAATFEDEILDVLAAYREVLFQSIVPQGQQSVHDFNKMMYLLGRELGIPGAEMMGEFDDGYMGEGFNAQQKRNEFHGLYSVNNILFESVRQAIEQTSDLRDKYFDWIKENIPHSWQKESFNAIAREVKKIGSLADKKRYLQEQDIYMLPNQSIEDAIETERKARYLALEVVEDMNAVPMKIKPSAIAYMLERIGVLQSL